MKFVMQTYQIIFEFLFLLQALEVATVMTLTSFAIIMELWTLASLLGLKAFWGVIEVSTDSCHFNVEWAECRN